MPPTRKDRVGEHRTALAKNRRIILQTQDICGICGQPVDKTIKYPDQLSPTVDHIIPVSKGGHPSDLSNLQLAHRYCNRMKSDKFLGPPGVIEKTAGGKKKTGTDLRPHEKTTGAEKQPGSKNNPPIKQPPPSTAWGDNDDLPLHCDWMNVSW